LHRKHKGYLDEVAVASTPENYEDRLAPMFPSARDQLRLFALEAHDLALSKLERNYERDREARRDLTLRLWLEPYWPV
jgi:hypothetical protein